MSLSHLSSLIRTNALHAQEHYTRVSLYIHSFHGNRFDNLQNFQNEMLELIKNLENIKVYVEHQQHQQLQLAKQYIQQFFKSHPLDHVSPKIRKRIIHILEDAFQDIIKDFKTEVINEGLLEHHQAPKHSFFKSFNSARVLDSRISSQVSKSDKINLIAHQEFGELLSTANAIAVGSHVDDQKLISEMKKFTAAIVKEFDVLLDEQLNAEIQENDLLKELRVLARDYHMHRELFLELAHKLEQRIHVDVGHAKDLYRISRDLRNYTRKAA